MPSTAQYNEVLGNYMGPVVDTYATTADGTLLGVSSLDMSMDLPTVGAGVYYVVRPLGCGSWQTGSGAEPDRDTALP